MIAASEFKAAMSAAVTGVTVVTTGTAEAPIGRTISAMCSVSVDPPLLLVCIRSDSPLCTAVFERGVFAVNVLSSGQVGVADAFAVRGRPVDWSAFRFSPAPVLRDAAASFVCNLAHSERVGTHTVFFGEVFAAEGGTAPPLAYTRREYSVPARAA